MGQRWATWRDHRAATGRLLGVRWAATGTVEAISRDGIAFLTVRSAQRLHVSVRAYLAEHDPDVLAAVEDVDRSLIQAELRRSPIERLIASVQQPRFYERLAASRRMAQGSTR